MARKEVAKQATAVRVSERTERGSRRSQAIRHTGMIPGIIYGRGLPSTAITAPLVETRNIIHGGAHTIDIELNGKMEKVLIKAVAYDYLNTTIEHVDFMRIDPNEVVRVKVPLEFRGIPKGAKEGGILEKQIVEIELEVKALEIPDVVRVNVENLELHGIIHAKEIVIPAGAKLINYAEQIICQVRTVKEEVAAVDAAAAPAEPEVIGKKKEEEGAEGAAPAAGGDKKAAAPKK